MLKMFAILRGGAGDSEVAAHARQHSRAPITRDFDFADIRNYPPHEYAGIIVLNLPDDAVAPQINRAIESFVQSSGFLERVPGRLAIVDAWRVRFRPV
jgi:hypothetical protein